MGLWPRQISRECSSMLARGKDLAEQKRQVRMMKPTVEEHWQARHEWGHVLGKTLGVWGREEDRRGEPYHHCRVKAKSLSRIPPTSPLPGSPPTPTTPHRVPSPQLLALCRYPKPARCCCNPPAFCLEYSPHSSLATSSSC